MISNGKFDIFQHNRTQNVLTADRHLCCLQWLEKTNLPKKFNKHVSIFVPSFFTTFDMDYHDKSGLMNFGDKAPSYGTVKNWFSKFNCGRRSLKDEVREGPPHISSNYRLIDWPNVESAAVQPWHSTQWLLFISVHQENNAWYTIFVTRRYCWRVQKPCFGAVSIGVETQTQMMVVYQNILSTVMLKNAKLSYGNVRFHLATTERC